MAITAAKIAELASRPDVKKIAVENFLGTLDDMTYEEAVLNCETDARSYRWNHATRGAIREGLMEHYFRQGRR